MSCGTTETACPPVSSIGADRYIITLCKNDVARRAQLAMCYNFHGDDVTQSLKPVRAAHADEITGLTHCAFPMHTTSYTGTRHLFIMRFKEKIIVHSR